MIIKTDQQISKSTNKQIKRFIIIVFALLLAGCKSGEKLPQNVVQEIPIIRNDNITISMGDYFEIHFTANASLGAWWQYINKQDVTIVDSVSQRYVSRAPEGMLGVASDLFIKFLAVKTGTDTLIFRFSRGLDENYTPTIVKKVVTVK